MSPHTITKKGSAKSRTRRRRDSLFGVGVRYPNFNEEKKLWRKGNKRIVGLDEAGRGPLAGPVTACAVTVLKIPNSKFQIPNKNSKSKYQISKRVLNFGHRDLIRNSDLGFRISKLRDSKKLSQQQREYFYKILTTHPQIKWGIGKVSEKVIDRINILEASKLAMKRALKNLEKKHSPADFLILDGNFKINSRIAQKSIIKADEKVFSCAAASIIAKVTRDRMMLRYHKKYPQYGFDKHKGYPTKLHRQIIKKYGFCKIHRRSFRVS